MSQERNLASEPCPWLAYSYGGYKKDQVFCSLSHPHTLIYRKEIPTVTADSHIVAHSYGWFLLSKINNYNDNDTHIHYLSLWKNPTILSHDHESSLIHLPPLFLKSTHKVTHYFLSMSSPPNEDPDSNSMVLLFVDDTLHPSLFCIHPAPASHQQPYWVEIPYGNHLHGCVSHNGNLYSFQSQGDDILVTLHVDKHNYHLTTHKLCPLPTRNTLNQVGLSLEVKFMNQLIECCGELLYVYIEYVVDPKIRSKPLDVIVEVSVFKLDFDKMIWERADDLMGQAVFFNALGNSWCSAFGEGMIEADSLYFKLPNTKSSQLYSFNLKDGCLSINIPTPNLPPICNSPKILVPLHVRLCNNEEQVDGKEDNTIVEIQTRETTLSDDDGKEDNTIVKIQTQETTLSDLPPGILMGIADCLNLFDYLNFRAACRDYQFINPKVKRKQALQKFKTCLPSSSIWLLLSTINMAALKFIDPVHGISFTMNLPESLKGSVVRYSRNGWLLMCDKKASMSFFNPFTEEIIKLAHTPTQVPVVSCAMAFSSLPTSSDCKIVGCYAFPPTCSTSKLSVLFSTMGKDKQWLNDYLENYGSFCLSNNSPLFYKGDFYLLGREGNLSLLDFVEVGTVVRPVRWVLLPQRVEPPCHYFQDNFLVECDGKLMSIFVGKTGDWLQVFSFNCCSLSWKRVFRLGNYVIYVSSSSCISKEASIKGTENRIYFPRFHENSMVFYSLDTLKFHADDGKGTTVENFYTTKKPLVATWIDEPIYKMYSL